MAESTADFRRPHFAPILGYDTTTLTRFLAATSMDVWFKRYPTCADANAALDGILEMVARHDIGADDVEEVRIKIYGAVEECSFNPEPPNVLAAMLSLPYSAAVAIVEKQVTPREFTEEKLGDERVNAVMRKVKVIVADEELNEFTAVSGLGAIVEIICQDGRRYETRVKACKGDTMNPFTEDELLEKFETLAASVLDHGKVNEMGCIVKRLEDVDDISNLTSLLRPEVVDLTSL